ncbi:hypothetical protein A2U01_0070902, partial [Trifolium medium]|nr:hypothetical protein [Trifolium medium]
MADKCIVAVMLDMCRAKALLEVVPQKANDTTGLIVFTASKEDEVARGLTFPGYAYTFG